MTGRELIAWNLRRLRVQKGLSQDRLAFDCDIDRAYLGGLERGTENPTVDLLDRIVGRLEVGLRELFVIPPSGSEPPSVLKRGRKRQG
jgi:transcriptional regulator with XRE-family HTH domain